MRGIDTQVRITRRRIFKEVAMLAYQSQSLKDDVEALPYKIVDYDETDFRENIYRERAIVRERIRLAMGLSLRPENVPVHVTQGLEESNISEKYYEPPLMQVIPSACNGCPENIYMITNMCMGCVAHPCNDICPKDAISMVNGKSVIDQAKCIKCGKCKAICPFGAIADKSQIFQLIRAMQSGKKVIAQVAPAFVGQFGPKVSPEQIKTALKILGFSEVYETAIGADMGAMAEAEHYVHAVAGGELPFLLTSCCPSWSVLAKKYFPETIDKISNALTPMVATARKIKEEHPDSLVVFIGPCASKKLEASRRTVRSDVDFVITFEELAGMFEAKEINLPEIESGEEIKDATAAGRGYGVAGGVASAIEQCIREYYPEVEVNIEHAESLAECKKMLLLAKAGKKNGCLIEGMACPGGCIAGAGTNIAIPQAVKAVNEFKKAARKEIPDLSL